MSAPSRYVVGIDPGTTNCALAYVDTAGLDPEGDGPESPEGRVAAPMVLPVAQVVAPGLVEPRPVLPSFLYLSAPGGNSFSAGRYRNDGRTGRSATSFSATTCGSARCRIGGGASEVASRVSAYARAQLVVPRSMPTT